MTQVNPLVSQAYAGTEAGGEWTGKVNLLADRLSQPLRWRKPRRIFVNAQSDLFHKDVPDEFIARVFAVMALAPQHVFQVLTKRHGRMRSLLRSDDFRPSVEDAMGGMVAAESLARGQRGGPGDSGPTHPGAARHPGRRSVGQRRAAAGTGGPVGAHAVLSLQGDPRVRTL